MIGEGGQIPEGSNFTENELGDTDGDESFTLTTAHLPRHRHGPGTLSASDAGLHSHYVGNYRSNHGPDRDSGGNSLGMGTATGHTASAGRHDHGITGRLANQGADETSITPIPLFQKSVVMNYLVKT